LVYLVLEMLVSVFALMILAILAFVACAAVLLAGEAMTDAYRALQEAGGVVSRLAVARRGLSLEGSRKGCFRPTPTLVSLFSRVVPDAGQSASIPA
jgi:hypothetical protein